MTSSAIFSLRFAKDRYVSLSYYLHGDADKHPLKR